MRINNINMKIPTSFTLTLPSFQFVPQSPTNHPALPSTPLTPITPVFEEFDGESLCRQFNPLADQLCVLCAEDQPTLRRIAKFREHFEDVALFAHLYDVAGFRVNG